MQAFRWSDIVVLNGTPLDVRTAELILIVVGSGNWLDITDSDNRSGPYSPAFSGCRRTANGGQPT